MAVDLTLTNENEGAAKRFGHDLMNAVKEGAQFDMFQSGVESMIKRAQEIGKARKAAEDANKGAVSGTAPPGVTPPGTGDGGKARKKLQDELESLISQYDRVYGAQLEVKKATELLDKAEAAGLITAERKADVLGLITEQLKDQLDPLGAVNRELNKELELLKLSSEAREVETQMRSIQQDLRMAGVKVGEQELKQLREQLVLIQQKTKIDQAAESLRGSTQGGRNEDFQTQLAGFQKLMKDNPASVTGADKFNFLNSVLGGTLDDTQNELNARIAQLEEYKGRVQALLQGGVIDTETAAMAETAIRKQQQQLQLQNVSDTLGTISGLMQSNNKTAFRIGKAAATAQAVMNTYTSAVNAYQSASAIPIVGWVLGPVAAAAAIAAGMANVNAIRNQQMPAYATGGQYVVGGSGGVDSQQVAFRATPGERISINTPKQAAALARLGEEGTGTQKAEPPRIRIINVSSEQEARNFANSDENEQIILNTLKKNGLFG